MKNWLLVLTALITLSYSCGAQHKDRHQISPIQLFDGKSLDNWTAKISHHEVGNNFGNTFRVEDGLLKIRYDNYDLFEQQYGHLAYKEPYSYYVLRVEYRFTGDQARGGEGWAWRNSGAMLHGQSPRTMLKDQDFPISIEAQFLGGNGDNDRTTSNLCTPGTNVMIHGELFTPHCKSSTSKTYHGDQWVRADFIVLGDSLIRHVLDGEMVMEYSQPQIGGGGVKSYDPAEMQEGRPLIGGYIYLQSESHPLDFRKVELYDLQKLKSDPSALDRAIQSILSK